MMHIEDHIKRIEREIFLLKNLLLIVSRTPSKHMEEPKDIEKALNRLTDTLARLKRIRDEEEQKL